MNRLTTRSLTIVSIVTFLTAFSCNEPRLDGTIFETVTATASAENLTKTSLVEENLEAGIVTLAWESTDRIGTFGAETVNSPFDVTSVSKTSVTFKGQQVRDDQLTAAYYPYSEEADQLNAVPVTIQETFTYSGARSISRSAIRATNSVILDGDYRFSFKLLTSYIKLNLDLSGIPGLYPDEEIQNYVLINESGHAFAGKYSLDLESLELSAVEAASQMKVLLASGAKASQGAISHVLSVAPAFRLGDQVGIRVETTRHTLYAHFECQSDFAAGCSYSFNLRFADATAEKNGYALKSTEVTYSNLPELSEMSLDQKIGQMFFVTPEALLGTSSSVTASSSTMTSRFASYPVGGVCLFAANIQNPTQLIALNKAFHNLPIYPIVTVDEEGGRVARIGKNSAFSVPTYTSMLAVGQSGNPSDARDAGINIGTYLYRYGFDLDFAPVADVFTNPANTVIGDRAFSTDASVAAAMVPAFLGGLQSACVEGCLKHFPGHGDTKSDSHSGFAEAPKTWAQMLACEMLPFKAAIAQGAQMIMAAHVTATNVTVNDVPASVSSELLTGKLRGELGYQGIIITDSMAMGAITSLYNSEQAAVNAVKAGADIILMPQNLATAFNGLKNAVTNGTISEARINESVSRILEMKRNILRQRGQLAE